jgi:leader peptidase (prepilin peptidase) / N-methyltransferase
MDRVRVGTALLAGVIVLVYGAGANAVLPLVLLFLLVPITLVDLERRIIPNAITAPGAAAAIAIGLVVDPSAVPGQLVSGLVAGGFFLLAVLAFPSGMGMGDVKLAGMMGLFLGRSVGVALLVALLAGALAGAAIMARRGVQAGRKTTVAFGPFLALGGVLATLAGDPIVDWYVHASA